MKWEVVHEKIKLRGFSPLSGWSNKVQRKIDLRWRLVNAFGYRNLPKIESKTINKPLFIDVCFYLQESDKLGKSKKDLDNLLKILFDVLSEDLVNGQNPQAGLGLMKDDSFVYKIKCEKKIVESEDEQGMDLLISRKV